jgi:hypothetical protein
MCSPYGAWLGLGTATPNGNLVVVEGTLDNTYPNAGIGGLRLATGSGQSFDFRRSQWGLQLGPSGKTGVS